jgi:hypothetical protein
MDIREKIEYAIRKKVDEGTIRESTITITRGGAQLTYGVARGALAVAGVLGHGLAGFALRRPLTSGAGARMIKQGFEAAGTNIDQGWATIEKGLSQRRNK